MPTPPKPTGSKAALKRAAAPTTEASHKRAATRNNAPADDDDVVRFSRGAAPPSWLNMSSAKGLQLNAAKVAHWTASAGGKAAAQRGEELDQLRLLGSVELSFTRDDSSDDLLAERLGLLEKPGKSRGADAKWYKARGAGRFDAPTETWHKTSGEFVGQGFVSPSLLLKAIFDGHLLPEQEWAAEVLEAVGLLTTPDAQLWGCPLMRTIIAPPAALRAVAMVRGSKGDKGGTKKRAIAVKQEAAQGGGAGSSSAEPTIELTAHVYVSRLLLYLCAHPSIRVLLSRLTPPAGGGIVQPIDALPSYPQCFLSHGGANASPFSLEGVLKACEHRGYREAAQPRGVALRLKRYQAQALAWMQDMERLPRGINGLFWEERAFGDGGTYHFSPQLGEMRLEAPPVMHGGLLCDEARLVCHPSTNDPSHPPTAPRVQPLTADPLTCTPQMGLGKTLELVSLVVATLEQPQPPPPDGLLASRATLIVVPVTLVSQWMAEIAKSVGAGSPLTYRKYTSDNLIKRDGGGAWRRAAAALAAHDIVVTTYPAVRKHCRTAALPHYRTSPRPHPKLQPLTPLPTLPPFQLDKCVAALPHVAWKRVVLDEMQEVRSSTTELARKCERLHGGLRWMVSGTPLYDKISDLQGELNFLRVSPFGAGHEDGFWRHVIGAPWQASDDSALDALQLLLNGVMMRHSKTQSWMDGTTILALPPRELVLAPVQLDGSERAAYVWLEQLIVAEVARTNALLEAGSAARSSGGALLVTGLRLLREASVAMHLLGGGGGVSEQLKPVEEIARAQLQALGRFGGPAAGAVDPADVDEVRLTRMTPSQTLQSLGSLDRRATEAAHASSLYNAQHRGDFQRHANQKQRVYDRSRSYAMESLDEKFEQAETKREELEQEAVAERWLAATRRWQWALERVTTGALLCRGLVGVNVDIGASADALPGPEPGPKSPLGGRFAWLWLHRAVRLHAADERLRIAEAALVHAEASVKAPALTRLRDGSYQNSCGEALHVLASPVRLREARTEEDEAFNREQLRGRVRKGVVVEVDGFSSDDGQHGRRDVRAEADDGDDEGGGDGDSDGEDEDEDGDAANDDERYVSVVADEPNGVPAGWVHNRHVVVGTKLYEACTKLGIKVDAAQLATDKDGRDAVAEEHRGVVFRKAFKGLRAARDEARALVRGTAAPAVCGRAPLRRLMEGPALAALGGGVRALGPVAALLAREPRPYATTAELLSQARVALLAAAGTAAGGGVWEPSPDATTAELLLKARAALLAAAGTAAATTATAAADKAVRTLRDLIEERVGAVGPIGWRPTSKALEAIRAQHADAATGWAWLRSSTLQLRGLPAAATGADLEAALGRFVGGGLARAVVVREGQPKGSALVNLGHEAGAASALREASASGKGLPLPLPAEAEALAAATRTLEADVERLKEAARGGKSADSKKLLEEKKRRLVELKAGRRAWLVGSGRASRPLLPAAGEATGVSIEPCGRFRTEVRAGVASLVLPRLLRDARAHGVQLRVAESSLNELLPYIAKLSAAIELGLDSSAVRAKRPPTPRQPTPAHSCSRHANSLASSGCPHHKPPHRPRHHLHTPHTSRHTASRHPSQVEQSGLQPHPNPDSRQVEQSGFQELFTLESGKPATGSCPICYERVGNASPCVAP